MLGVSGTVLALSALLAVVINSARIAGWYVQKIWVLLNKYRFPVIPIGHEQFNRAFKHVLAFTVTLGFPFQPCQAVPQQTVVAFRRVGLRLGLRMQRSGNKMLVRLPIICHHRFDSRTLDVRPEPPPRFRVAGAHSAAEEPSPMSINSRPDPAVVFLCPT